MANPVQTNGTHNRQEKYARAIVELMRPTLKIRNTFSRDYEGDPVSGAVKVPVRNMDPEIKDYDVKNGVDLGQSATDYINIPVDKHDAINELIDGYEAQAVPDNLVAQRLEAGAYSRSKKLEADAIAALINNSVPSTQADSTDTTIYENILRDIAILAKKGVDKNRMKVAISYETETLLLLDERFANSASQIGSELARTGVVGRVNGVDVLTEDLGENAQGQAVEYIVYGIDWVQAVDGWMIPLAINDIKDGKHVGASALQDRYVYTDAVTNKEAVIIKSKVGISAVTITPVTTLSGTLVADTKVADLDSVGGNGAVTYSLPTGVADNDEFEIGTNVVQVKTSVSAGQYTIVVKGTDTASNEASATAVITVAEGE